MYELQFSYVCIIIKYKNKSKTLSRPLSIFPQLTLLISKYCKSFFAECMRKFYTFSFARLELHTECCTCK